MDVTIIAQEFKWEKNCGSLARVMANFGFEKLVFLNPKCGFRGKEAVMHAKHAKAILEKAKTLKSFSGALKKYDTVIATTAMLGTDYNIARSPISPDKLSGKIKGKTAIIIGREGEGMSNEEIQKCDFVVTIPSSKKYPTLNVSHAAAVILYELSKHSRKEKLPSFPLATRKEKEVLMKLLDKALSRMEFSTEEKKQTQRLIWRRMLGKAMLTRREAYALCGFLKKIKQ
ncbi:MAG: TrmJ/YjtD family RNA methyltransferase [Candidatus Nanoarchaeia archaeon]|nr:TrmJ/YjtD family RNA methyltransferase [Candidatus Nanoarchaeia archaeon]